MIWDLFMILSREFWDYLWYLQGIYDIYLWYFRRIPEIIYGTSIDTKGAISILGCETILKCPTKRVCLFKSLLYMIDVSANQAWLHPNRTVGSPEHIPENKKSKYRFLVSCISASLAWRLLYCNFHFHRYFHVTTHVHYSIGYSKCGMW